MNVDFVKMSGAGNDMILVDHRTRALAGREADFARAACERRFGIGADGVVLLENDGELDFSVRFFNPDGGEYELCGNGARCIPRFARGIGFPGRRFVFRSPSGVHRAEYLSENRARLTLAPVRETRLGVPVRPGCGTLGALDWGDIGGVPHATAWVECVDGVPVAEWGELLSRDPAFDPAGTNVSFVERRGPGELAIRTFERGVEGETMACGSGSAIAATLGRQRGYLSLDTVNLRVRSGDVLTIRLPAEATGAPVLEGPVLRAFSGSAILEELLSRAAGKP